MVEDSFGWDEASQSERFKDLYETNWFHWIEANDTRVGYICYWTKAAELHVSLLIIDKEKRGQGHGHAVMERLHTEARLKNCCITLSSFRKNFSAIQFYEKLGYLVVGGDDHFLDMKLVAP